MADRVQAAVLRAPVRALLVVAAAALLTTGCRSHRSLEEIEAALGQAPPPSRPEDDDSLDAEFDRLVRLFARDDVPMFEPELLRLAGRTTHDRVVQLEASRCYTFLALANPDSIDLDLELTNPDGNVVAADRAPDAFPVLHVYCADVTGDFALRARSERGDGLARLGGWVVEDGAAAVAAQRLAALRAAHLPDGQAAGAMGRAFVRAGDSHDVPVPVAPGTCVGAVAVGDVSLTDLDAAWVTPDGEEPIRDVGLPDVAVLAPWCAPPEGAALRLRLRAYDGEGVASWLVIEAD